MAKVGSVLFEVVVVVVQVVPGAAAVEVVLGAAAVEVVLGAAVVELVLSCCGSGPWSCCCNGS